MKVIDRRFGAGFGARELVGKDFILVYLRDCMAMIAAAQGIVTRQIARVE
jgi:hypothetical protein